MTTARRKVAAPTTTRRGLAESQRFVRALVDLAARGLRTHCSDAGAGGLWLSGDPVHRVRGSRLVVR